MNVKLKGKETPSNRYWVSTKINGVWVVHWHNVKNEKPDNSEELNKIDFNKKD